MVLQSSPIPSATLDDVLITDELTRRPTRAANPVAEAEALHSIARVMSRDPQVTLDALVDAAMKLCNAGAAGVSLFDPGAGGPGVFRWVALAGSYESYVNNTTPGDHSPCGTCLARGAPQLYHWPGRFFTSLAQADPPIVEGLVVPFHAGETLGTIWIISHHDVKQFTGEDVRVMTSLAEFAGATLAAQYANAALRVRTQELESSQRALMAQKHFAEQVIESCGDCIKVLDVDGRLLSINTPGQALLEIDDFSSCQNQVWTEFWSGSGNDAARQAVASALAGEVGSFEGSCPTAKGTPKWWQVSVMPIMGSSPTPEKLLVVSRDVTIRKQSEEKIHEALSAAQTANRNKDLFLAALSHELRTPLSPVLLAVTAMQTGPSLEPEALHYLEMIRRNVELEVRLIDDLLDVSRAASGKLRLNVERAGLHGLLQFVRETCSSDAGRKKISIGFSLSARHDAATVDAARVQQVFWNILKNAIKFSDEGQCVEISTSNPREGQIEIRFRDYGRGISPEVIPCLFSAFNQGGSDVTQQFGGLGLGLAISKAIVEMHGGEIEAQSEGPGRGATFIVRLPLCAAAAPTVPAPSRPADAKASEAGLRLLLVEDHADTARVLSMLLRSSGYAVETAGTAAAAMGAMAHQPFDLVLSDIGLPDATGYELMRQIRDRFQIKGIAMTGYGMDEDYARSRDAGFVAHVVKPINLEQLDQVIRRVGGMAPP